MKSRVQAAAAALILLGASAPSPTRATESAPEPSETPRATEDAGAPERYVDELVAQLARQFREHPEIQQSWAESLADFQAYLEEREDALEDAARNARRSDDGSREGLHALR